MLRGSSYSLVLTRSTVLVEMLHWAAIRLGASPSLIPLRIARRSKLSSGSFLLARGGFSRSLSNSLAISGLSGPRVCRILGLRCVIIVALLPEYCRGLVVFIRYATLTFPDSLNSLPV